MLDCSETHVRNLVKQKLLPEGRRVGRKLVRWFREDVLAFIWSLRRGESPS